MLIFVSLLSLTSPVPLYEVDPLESVGVAFLLASALAADLDKHRWDGLAPCALGHEIDDVPRCRTDDLPSIDRGVLAHRSQEAERWSDILLASAMALPFAVHAFDAASSDSKSPWEDLASGALVSGESLALTYAAVAILKSSVHRPRPYVYFDDPPDERRTRGDARLSFPSGHAAMAFASAALTASLLIERHGAAPISIAGTMGAYTFAVTTGFLRVFAGMHFWTDVFAGAVLGTGAALLVMNLHRPTRSVTLGEPAVDGPDRGRALQFTFSGQW